MARRTAIFTRGPKRKTLWLQFAPISASLTATGGILYFSLNAAALALRPFTIVRTKWEAFITSDQAAAVEDQVAGMGLAVVSDEAVAVGVSAVPTPISELGSSLWFMHKILMSAGSNVNEGRVGFQYTVDSKAMRKVEVGQDIVAVGEFSAAGDGLLLTMGGRILIKTN